MGITVSDRHESMGIIGAHHSGLRCEASMTVVGAMSGQRCSGWCTTSRAGGMRKCASWSQTISIPLPAGRVQVHHVHDGSTSVVSSCLPQSGTSYSFRTPHVIPPCRCVPRRCLLLHVWWRSTVSRPRIGAHFCVGTHGLPTEGRQEGYRLVSLSSGGLAVPKGSTSSSVSSPHYLRIGICARVWVQWCPK